MGKDGVGDVGVVLLVRVDPIVRDRFQRNCVPPAVTVGACFGRVTTTFVPRTWLAISPDLATREKEAYGLGGGIVPPVVVEEALKRLIYASNGIRERSSP